MHTTLWPIYQSQNAWCGHRMRRRRVIILQLDFVHLVHLIFHYFLHAQRTSCSLHARIIWSEVGRCGRITPARGEISERAATYRQIAFRPRCQPLTFYSHSTMPFPMLISLGRANKRQGQSGPQARRGRALARHFFTLLSLLFALMHINTQPRTKLVESLAPRHFVCLNTKHARPASRSKFGTLWVGLAPALLQCQIACWMIDRPLKKLALLHSKLSATKFALITDCGQKTF